MEILKATERYSQEFLEENVPLFGLEDSSDRDKV
jgi:hypothetical protein